MLFGRRATTTAAAHVVVISDDERQRWAAERRMLLEDSVSVRAEIAQMQQVLDAFRTFDARRAECFIENDKQCLLGVIETGTTPSSNVTLPGPLSKCSPSLVPTLVW